MVRIRAAAPRGPAVIWLAVLLFAGLAVADTTDQPSILFGHPLFSPVYLTTPLDAGYIYTLTSIQRALLNVEHSGDLLGWDVGFFHPDLVTAGREVCLSSLGAGLSGTKLLWRGRPFRQLRTGRADLSLIPPSVVGGVRAVHWGGLSGVISPGAAIEFQPLQPQSNIPLTYLYHREGFYDFEPVEFIHTRRFGPGTRVSFGGFFPSSRGRFYHSAYSGQTLHGQLAIDLSAQEELSISYMFGKHKTEYPRDENIQITDNRGDLDLNYTTRMGDGAWFDLGLYRVESRIKQGGLREYNRELGLVGRIVRGGVGGYLRLSRLDASLPGGGDYGLSELEGSLSWRGDYGRLSAWFVGGGSGWWPDRLRPVAAAGIEADLTPFGTPFVHLKQAVDPHSLEMMFADYDTARVIEEYEPVWGRYPDCPIIGGTLPVTVTRGGRVGVRRALPLGILELSCFDRVELHPACWRLQGDSLITPVGLDRRETVGWEASYRFEWGPYRGYLALVDFQSESSPRMEVPTFHLEPDFRLVWEAGWHREFYNGDFETDLSFSGRYYGRYEAYPVGERSLGGAYPLDFKATARIRRFSIYWGLHNWNSYQYYLVPGYKMMHREEYWGIHWLLLD